MTVSELIEMLKQHPADLRVTLCDPDTGYLLPVKLAHLPATTSASKPSEGDRSEDFLAIYGVYGDGIEGHGPFGGPPHS